MSHDECRRDDDADRTEETVGPDGSRWIITYDKFERVMQTITSPTLNACNTYDVDRASSQDNGMLSDDNLHSNGSR